VTVCLRYALYFAPAPGSAWARFGADWFARPDPRRESPRRYGFHATLKAPFRLRSGAQARDLFAEVDQFTRAKRAFSVASLRVACLMISSPWYRRRRIRASTGWPRNA
jgi:hypothetical protein